MENWTNQPDPAIPSTSWVRSLINKLTNQITNISGVLPDQTGHGGEYLTTDGTNASWAATSGGVDEFIELIDAPSSYTGFSGYLPNVNVAESGLQFVDIGLTPDITVDAVTVNALPANTYNNGAAGVGATITINALGQFPTIDSQPAVLNNDYLIKNYTGANRYKNGVYKLTTLGNGGASAVLTRTTTSDDASEFDDQLVFAAYAAAGSTNGGKFFIQTAPVTTVGTDAVVYVQNRIGGGNQSLYQVLGVGDDAGGRNIENVGLLGIGKVPTVELDVFGDVFVENATYTDGLFQINETNGDIFLGDGTDSSHAVNGTVIHIKDSTQNIHIVCSVPAPVPTGQAVLYMGEATAAGYAGFTAGFGNDNKDQGEFNIGRGTGSGTLLKVQDNTDTTGFIRADIQATGHFTVTTFASATEMIKMDMAFGTGAGIWTIGNTAKTDLVINDSTQTITLKSPTTGSFNVLMGDQTLADAYGEIYVSNSRVAFYTQAVTATKGVGIELATGGRTINIYGTDNNTQIYLDDTAQTIAFVATSGTTMNGAPTYTGTVAGAAGLSVVNGVIMQ